MKAVIVPIAANAVIGTIQAIWQVGAGSKMSTIGTTMIGNVGAMVIIGNLLRSVMVQHVLDGLSLRYHVVLCLCDNNRV